MSELAALGYQVDLLVLPLGEDVEIPGVTIVRASRIPGLKSAPIGASWQKLLWDLSIFLKATLLVLRAQLSRERYYVIHGIEEGGVMAAFLGKLLRIPYIFDMHSRMSDQLEASNFLRSKGLLSFVRRLEEWCIRGSAGVVTVGEELTNLANALSQKVRAFSLPDLPLDSLENVSREMMLQMKRELNVDGRRVLLYTGNFESYQGIDLLLHSFRELLRRDLSEQPLLLLVGGGSGSAHLLKKYQTVVRELGLEDSVYFTGERPSEEMGVFLELADVLLSPRIEGNNPPLKIYSYMATAKPIVATTIISHTQVLDEECAFMAEPDPKSFSEAMWRALDSSALSIAEQRRRGEEARSRQQTLFSREVFALRLHQLYSGVRALTVQSSWLAFSVPFL